LLRNYNELGGFDPDDFSKLDDFKNFLIENEILPFHPEDLKRYFQLFEKKFPIIRDKELAKELCKYSRRFAYDIMNHFDSINKKRGEIENGT